MINFFFIFLILILLNIKLKAQDGNFQEYERGYMRLLFYNTENLFDIFDDSTKTDEDFTPEGDKYWNNNRYYKKLNNISKVITAVGQWDAPDIIGLCEVENRFVLEGITKKTKLKKYDYRIIHYESSDNRGIDVGLLYRKDRFTPISYEPIHIRFVNDGNKPTRDILYVVGYNNNKDTLHIFINHWPSRWGGQMETDDKRRYVADILRKKVDSLFVAEINPKIVIMGDLNDYPDNSSLLEHLKIQTSFENIKDEDLYSLAYYLQFTKGKGSHKHEATWGVLDQIIVSGSLLNVNNKLHTTKDDAHVFDAPFLLEPDDVYTGYKSFRTYIGFKFNDGFSDHLPVYLDLWKKE